MVHRTWLFVGIACSWFACSRPAEPNQSAAAPVAVAAPDRPHQLTVFATDSARAPCTALARLYEQQHPGASVALRCEGGAQLVSALLAGAPADVVVIADSSLMSRLAAGALLAPGSPTELTRNRLALVVAKGNPRQIQTLSDCNRTGVRLALGARSASIGRHGRWVLSRLELHPEPAVEAPTAAGVLEHIAAGRADVGIVYQTTLRGAPDTVQAVELPLADNTAALYSISAIREAPEPQAAAAFRALALGADGQRQFAEHGFLPQGTKD